MKLLFDYLAIFAILGGALTILFGTLLAVALWSLRRARAAETEHDPFSEPWGHRES